MGENFDLARFLMTHVIGTDTGDARYCNYGLGALLLSLRFISRGEGWPGPVFERSDEGRSVNEQNTDDTKL